MRCGKMMFPLMSSLLCAACAPPLGVIPPDAYDPASDARIRVYSVPDHYIWLFPNQLCTSIAKPAYRGKKFLGVSTGVDQFLRTIHIGMPRSDHEHDARYNEFVIKAGEPLTLMAKYIELVTADPMTPYVINGGETCGPRFVTLVPRPGHDYEVFSDTCWPTRGMNDCQIHLYEIKKAGNESKTVPVDQAEYRLQCGLSR